MKRICVSLEITHFCNKNCDLCSHRISGSNYQFLTETQYTLIVKNLQGFSISQIELTGGEPLTHPYFNRLVINLKKDFPSARLVLFTNGKKLLELSKEERERFSRIYIPWYQGFNDLEIDRVVKEKNIFIKNRPMFSDPFIDPQLSAKAAIKVYKNCSMKFFRFVGTKIYSCCLAEGIERTYDSGCVHVEVQPDFIRELKNIPTYRACMHCFYAPRILTDFMLRIKNRIRNLRRHLLAGGVLSKFGFRFPWSIYRAMHNRKSWYKYHKKGCSIQLHTI